MAKKYYRFYLLFIIIDYKETAGFALRIKKSPEGDYYESSRLSVLRSFSIVGFFFTSISYCFVLSYICFSTVVLFTVIFITGIMLPNPTAMPFVMRSACCSKSPATNWLSTEIVKVLPPTSVGVIIFILSASALSFSGSCIANAVHACTSVSCVSGFSAGCAVAAGVALLFCGIDAPFGAGAFSCTSDVRAR